MGLTAHKVFEITDEELEPQSYLELAPSVEDPHEAPVEPVDVAAPVEPERVEPERVEPERVEPEPVAEVAPSPRKAVRPEVLAPAPAKVKEVAAKPRTRRGSGQRFAPILLGTAAAVAALIVGRSVIAPAPKPAPSKSPTTAERNPSKLKAPAHKSHAPAIAHHHNVRHERVGSHNSASPTPVAPATQGQTKQAPPASPAPARPAPTTNSTASGYEREFSFESAKQGER